MFNDNNFDASKPIPSNHSYRKIKNKALGMSCMTCSTRSWRTVNSSRNTCCSSGDMLFHFLCLTGFVRNSRRFFRRTGLCISMMAKIWKSAQATGTCHQRMMVPSKKGTELVSYSFGALSPVNHKGLHQGWTQTSLYLQVIHSTSLFFFSQTTAQILSTISERKTRKTVTHVLEPIHILRALNMGTCIQQGDLFYSLGLHRERC